MDKPSPYATRANRHRPTEPALLAVEVRRMHADGLTARDISTALHLALDSVIVILYGEPENARIREHR